MIAALLVLGCVLADGTPRHAASEIHPDGELRGFRLAPIDGDDAIDLVVAVWSPVRGRELFVHLQRGDGTFAATPDRRVDIKSDVIAYAVADLRDEPGSELLLLTRSAGFGLSTARRGYAGNARRLFERELICPIPDRKDVLFLDTVVDLEGDGSPEVLVPGPGGFSLLARGEAGAEPPFVERARFAVTGRETLDGSSALRHRLELSAGHGISHVRSSAFTGLVTPWPGSDESAGPFLRMERWLPAPHVGDANGDGRPDVCWLEVDDERSTVKLFVQRDDGRFASSPDWSGQIEHDGSLLARDLDGDGLFDLISGGNRGDRSMRLRLFLNRGGRFDGERPDQVLKLSGYGIEPEVLDLDGDGRPELVVSSYSVSAVGALRGGAVTRTLLVFRGGDGGGVFGKRPASRLDERFTAREVKGLSQRMTFAADLRGDGRRHALHLDDRGALVARAFDQSLRLESEPFWRFVPRRTVTGIVAAELNGDRRADVVLEHSRSLTVLVSR